MSGFGNEQYFPPVPATSVDNTATGYNYLVQPESIVQNSLHNEMLSEWNSSSATIQPQVPVTSSEGLSSANTSTATNELWNFNVVQDFNGVNNINEIHNSHGMHQIPHHSQNHFNMYSPYQRNYCLNSFQNYGQDINNRLVGGKKKLKRLRTAFTSDQMMVLEQEYTKARYLERARRLELANILHLNERTIKIWFQNRRMKEKKDREENVQGEDVASFAPIHSLQPDNGQNQVIMRMDTNHIHPQICDFDPGSGPAARYISVVPEVNGVPSSRYSFHNVDSQQAGISEFDLSWLNTYLKEDEY